MAITPEPSRPAETAGDPPAGIPDAPGVLDGEMEVLGLLPGSSNYTFLARLHGDGTLVVYKPRQGERPLWDFPGGTLCQRETAAYLVSRMGGWDHVPATVLRDGPLEVGAVQRFVEHDPAVTAFDLLRTHPDELRSIAVFDLVANNADRKAGHVLQDRSGRVWGIDHGLCFHEEPKLRTVLWHFVGEPVPEQELERLRRIRARLQSDELAVLLSPVEVDAMGQRIELLLEEGVFPEPDEDRPAVPWPPV